MTADNCLGTAPPSYLCVIGYSWAVALAWERAFPSEPFLGIRVDPEEVWVVFEPKTAAGPIPRPVFEQVAQAFEDTGAASISDNVFFYEGPSLGAAHRLARRVVSILQIGDYRRPPTQPLVQAEGLPTLWERVAITREQIAERRLTPIIKTDQRYKGRGGVHEAWECEALNQATIVEIVRARLDAHLPEPLADVLVREAAEREQERRRLRRRR